MNKHVVRIVLIAVIIALNIGCDQSTKYIAKKELPFMGKVNVVGEFFILEYTENNGAFLGIFSSLPDTVRQIVLLAIPVVALFLLLLYILFNFRMTTVQMAAFSTILGGGISNIYDRFFNNEYVVDFMNVGIGPVRSGIFNFADLSIMAGLAVVLYFQILEYRKNTEEEHSQ